MKKFEQFKSAYESIVRNNKIGDFSEVYVSAITSDFDRLFELAWKTMKEYMYKNLGMHAAKTGSPKEILSLAHNQGIIKDGAVWLEMLQNRNDDAHIYRLSVAVIYKSKIEEVYLGYMKELIDYFKDVIPDEQIQAAKVSEDLLEEAKIKGVPLWELAVKEAKKQDVSVDYIVEHWKKP